MQKRPSIASQRVFRAALLGCLAVAALAAPLMASSRINEGTTNWLNAATTGRADMLVLGDSIVSYGSDGWSSGLARTFQQSSIGLAGSGLLTAPNGSNAFFDSYAGARIWSGGTTPATEITPALAGHAVTGDVYDADKQFAFVGTGGPDPVTLSGTKGYDWHVFVAPESAAAQLGAEFHQRTLATFSDTLVQTLPSQSITTPANGGLNHQVFHFAPTTVAGDWSTFGFTAASKDAALYYTKVTQTGSTGATVTGWSDPGNTAASFRTGVYENPSWSSAGRTDYYNALTADNSGSLNVVIAFGVNDAFQGASPSDYGSSIQALMADVRSDWKSGGRDISKLSFTLLSTYQFDQAHVPAEAWTRLQQYRAILDAIAAGDKQVSFVDLWGAGPTSAEAVANGYLADGIHPSALGTSVYSQLVYDQLTSVPEPTTILSLAGVTAMATRRQRHAIR